MLHVGAVCSGGVRAVAVVDMPKYAMLNNSSSPTLHRLLVLEGLQDPGNLVRPAPTI